MAIKTNKMNKTDLINKVTQEAKPYIIAYNKALKEMWGKPINRDNDLQTLEKYGLVSKWSYNKASYQWNYQLLQLNKTYKEALKIK